MTSDTSVDSFFAAAAAELGPVDILANAAGITAEQTISGPPDPLWDRVIDVNLTGIYRCIKRALPGMMERDWGRIVNIASTAASVGAATSGAYCASKAGVVGLTRAVALEGAPNRCYVQLDKPYVGEYRLRAGTGWAISPRNKMTVAATSTSPMSWMPTPRAGWSTPLRSAPLALFLCREEALGMTMQDLTLSAGSLW